MIPLRRTPRRAALLAGLILFAGCGDDDGTGPAFDYEPEETLDQFDQVLDPLNANPDAFLGLDAAGQAVLDFAGFTSAAAIMVRPGTGLDAVSVDRMRTARAVWSPELELPDAVIGETLVWDVSDDRYVIDQGATGAPSNGVRVVLYRMDSDATPREPLVELGFMDLTDEDLLNSERLGIRVVNTEGATNVELLDYYIDFTISGTQSQGTMRFEARGALSDGVETLDFELSQTFAWSESQNEETLVLDYEYRHEDDEVLFRLDTAMPFEGQAWGDLGLRVELQGGPENIVIDAGMDVAGNIEGTIERNGGLVIRIAGVDPNPVFTRPDGSQPSSAQMAALAQIWEGVVSLISLTEWLFVPTAVLLLPG